MFDYLGYRIQSSSFAHPVIPTDDDLFTGPSWVRHQIAVTKYKENEDTTLSYATQGNQNRTQAFVIFIFDDGKMVQNKGHPIVQ